MTSTLEAVESWINRANADELRDLKRAISERIKVIERRCAVERAQRMEARDGLRAPWVEAIAQIVIDLDVSHCETTLHSKEDFSYAAFWEKMLRAARGQKAHKSIDIAWSRAEMEAGTRCQMQKKWIDRNTVEMEALRQMPPRKRMQMILDTIVMNYASGLRYNRELVRAYYFWEWQCGSFFDRAKPGFRPMTIDEWYEHDADWFRIQPVDTDRALELLRGRGIG